MYWPLGAPRSYAASQKVPSQERSGEVNEQHVKSTTNGGHDSDSVTSVAVPAESDARKDEGHDDNLIGVRLARGGSLFATWTACRVTFWQAKPTVAVASTVRSLQSLSTYGPNVSLLLRPDSAIFVVQASKGYLITYSLVIDSESRMYKPSFHGDGHNGSVRRPSNGNGIHQNKEFNSTLECGIAEVSIHFRMVIKIDAGIYNALALDDELVIATDKPAALQCIRWTPESTSNQTSTELLTRLPWLKKKTTICEMVYDRPMNLSAWVGSDGAGYAVVRNHASNATTPETHKALFSGYEFHECGNESRGASKIAINARFSLIVVGCQNGDLLAYSVKDYKGPIPYSHTYPRPVSEAVSGKIKFLCFSPDGYCLFVGLENGWMTWSVFGKALASSFGSETKELQARSEEWLGGVKDGFWLGGGTEILLLPMRDNGLWILEMARSACTGVHNFSNSSRCLLQTSSGLIIYKGHGVGESSALLTDSSLWHHVQAPRGYLNNQWPIRFSVISEDGRYLAIAGRRGLAHYSVQSGRWKSFQESDAENEFAVRGGMFWHGHLLVVAVECATSNDLRMYSREDALQKDTTIIVESLSAPVITISASGHDSVLVYTRDNSLRHYVFSDDFKTTRLMLVGQIAFHGIIRAPLRVRAVTWILAEDQYEFGDPAQDVSNATLVFLIDGKLVALQPTSNKEGELKYQMRVIAQNVEFFAITTTDRPSDASDAAPQVELAADNTPLCTTASAPRHEPLWYFDGQAAHMWTDHRQMATNSRLESSKDWPQPLKVALDFYPLSLAVDSGVLIGIESELVQRRDVDFSLYRTAIRTQLYLPALFRHFLAANDNAAAFSLAHGYAHLRYFPHMLEILLHEVLDEEVESEPTSDVAVLPRVLRFLSSFPHYLDIVVQCTRKTEVLSWRTLFKYLPPPRELFEESLQRGDLKTAGGYLLVLHTLEEVESNFDQLLRLMRRSMDEEDWDLCRELARFLLAVDNTGQTLRNTIEGLGIAIGVQ